MKDVKNSLNQEKSIKKDLKDLRQRCDSLKESIDEKTKELNVSPFRSRIIC
jgi:hypothetical protein